MWVEFHSIKFVKSEKLLLFDRCRFRSRCDVIAPANSVLIGACALSITLHIHTHELFGSLDDSFYCFASSNHTRTTIQLTKVTLGRTMANGFVPIKMKLIHYFSVGAMEHEFHDVGANCTRKCRKKSRPKTATTHSHTKQTRARTHSEFINNNNNNNNNERRNHRRHRATTTKL